MVLLVLQNFTKDDSRQATGLQSDPGKYCIVVNYVVFEANKKKFKLILQFGVCDQLTLAELQKLARFLKLWV